LLWLELFHVLSLAGGNKSRPSFGDFGNCKAVDIFSRRSLRMQNQQHTRYVCHFQDCELLLVTSLTPESSATASTGPLPFTFMWIAVASASCAFTAAYE